jgi:HD-like signal output (HDOD) protein
MVLGFFKKMFSADDKTASKPSQPVQAQKPVQSNRAVNPTPTPTAAAESRRAEMASATDYSQLSSSFNDFLLDSADQEQLQPNEIEQFIIQTLEEMLQGDIPDAVVPRLPDAAMALLKELSDPNISAQTIMAQINRDPVLASEVLTMSNSALFRGAQAEKIVNLEKAVVLLGLNNLKMIVSSALMQRLMVIAPVYFRMFGQHLWQHSLDCAHACKALSNMYGQSDPNNAYLVGLMHDIGKLAIFGLLIKALSRHLDYKPRGSVFSGIVRNHSQALSVRIARKWNLPDYLIEALAEQQSGHNLSEFSIYGLILNQANILAEFKTIADKNAQSPEQFDELATRYSIPLHLYRQAFPEQPIA